MSTEVTLPALGESVTEGTVSRWLKEVGEHVEMDEPLLEVSTDKVDTEVPSPVSGTLLEIRVNEDEEAPVGAVLAIIGDASEAQQGAPTPQPAAPAPQPAPQPPAAPAPAPAASDATEVLLPALGESVTEGTVSRWLKAVGEQVDQRGIEIVDAFAQLQQLGVRRRGHGLTLISSILKTSVWRGGMWPRPASP